MANLPSPSDNDCPLQLCTIALSAKDRKVVHCSIPSECTSLRILRVNGEVPAQGEDRTEPEGDECPSMFLSERVEKFHVGM
jgi:hypothetical protein